MRHFVYITVCTMIFAGCIQEINYFNVEESTECVSTENIKTKGTSSVHYYWHNNERIYFSPVADTYFAIFQQQDVQSLTQLISSRNVDFQVKKCNLQHLTGTQEQNTFISAKITGNVAEEYSESIVYIAPYLNGPYGTVGVSNRFYVKLKSGNDVKLLEDFASENGAEIILENFIPLWYTLICGESSSGNALELANKAYESGTFEKTDVEFIDDFEWNDSNFTMTSIILHINGICTAHMV